MSVATRSDASLRPDRLPTYLAGPAGVRTPLTGERRADWQDRFRRCRMQAQIQAAAAGIEYTHIHRAEVDPAPVVTDHTARRRGPAGAVAGERMAA